MKYGQPSLVQTVKRWPGRACSRMEGARRNMKVDGDSYEVKTMKLNAFKAMYDYLSTERQPSSAVTPSLAPKVSKS